jgi:integrase
MPVRDSRNRRIAGLSERNGRFYGVLWTDRGDGRKGARRFPLLDGDGGPIRTITAAKAAFDTLRNARRENTLPQPGHKPAFDAFAAEYLEMASTRAKRGATQNKESDALARWRIHFAGIRLDRIATPLLRSFVEMRLRGCKLDGKTYEAASPRTVTLDLIALRNVLKAGVEAGHLREIPRFPKLQTPPAPRRALVTPAEFDRLLAACTATKKDGDPVTKNGEQLRDFLRLLAFTGAREQEALRLKWAHVDFTGRRIFIGAEDDFTAAAMTIGTGGTSKNRGSRSVDFGPQLESLLREMHARRAPDCSCIFPSPQRGGRDIPARTLRQSLKLARAKAALPHVGFHDLRHLFCSFAVMAGIDFLTIAGWLGHKDGGILIGKIYGHLLDAHRQNMAARLTIGIAPLAEAAK